MISSEVLKKLQLTEALMLEDIDAFCRNNAIKYSLAGGNLIGAVRHKGFIPWDDDMDIIMTRNDYLKFVDAWKTKALENYTAFFECNKITGLTHTKITRNNTILISGDKYSYNGSNGIWIDIFVMDKLPMNTKQRNRILRLAKLRILLCRNKAFKTGGLVKYILSLLARLIPWSIKSKIINKINSNIFKYKDLNTNFEYVELSAPGLLSYFYPHYILDDYVYVPYDSFKFPITKHFDKLLNIRFGNYMELPPEKERICKHNPEIIVFDEKIYAKH